MRTITPQVIMANPRHLNPNQKITNNAHQLQQEQPRPLCQPVLFPGQPRANTFRLIQPKIQPNIGTEVLVANQGTKNIQQQSLSALLVISLVKIMMT